MTRPAAGSPSGAHRPLDERSARTTSGTSGSVDAEVRPLVDRTNLARMALIGAAATIIGTNAWKAYYPKIRPSRQAAR